MTLIDIFNCFDELSRRVSLTSDARSLFLAFLQHWNRQRRPAIVDITVTVLRQTANLNDESYRRAAISLSNNNLWKMKRKAHDKLGRWIQIGSAFGNLGYSGQNEDRREIDAKSAILAPPPTPPSERKEELPNGNSSFPETKTETAHANEKPPLETDGFSIEYFRGRKYNTLTQPELNWINKLPENKYNQVINSLSPLF